MTKLNINGRTYKLKTDLAELSIEDVTNLSLIEMPDRLQRLIKNPNEKNVEAITEQDIEVDFPNYYRCVIGTLSEIPRSIVNKITAEAITSIYKLVADIVIQLEGLDFEPVAPERLLGPRVLLAPRSATDRVDAGEELREPLLHPLKPRLVPVPLGLDVSFQHHTMPRQRAGFGHCLVQRKLYAVQRVVDALVEPNLLPPELLKGVQPHMDYIVVAHCSGSGVGSGRGVIVTLSPLQTHSRVRSTGARTPLPPSVKISLMPFAEPE